MSQTREESNAGEQGMVQTEPRFGTPFITTQSSLSLDPEALKPLLRRYLS